MEIPDFQVVIHLRTKRRTGRIFFPKSYLLQHQDKVSKWLEKRTIYFIPDWVKLYSDGSFRLFFEASEAEYNNIKTLFQ